MNILLIATARKNQIEEAVLKMQQLYSDTNLFLLSFNDIADFSDLNVEVFRIKPQKNQFSIFFDLKDTKKIIENIKFEKLVLLYNNIYGCDYMHLEMLSYFVSAKERLIFDVEKNIYPISLWKIFKRVCINKVLFFLFLPVLAPFIIIKKLK